MTNSAQSPPQADPQEGDASACRHVADAGDCCHSIAIAAGHVWKSVWCVNNEIHSSRQPNQLVPGDAIQVPPIELKHESRPTDKRHVFVRPGSLVCFRLRLVHGGRPIEKESYVLHVDSLSFRGRTNGAGILDHLIPATAKEAILEVPRLLLEMRIRIGALPPAGNILGIQARLRNLGYGCDLTGENDAGTSAALKWFQADMRLEESGNPDQETISALEREHGV